MALDTKHRSSIYNKLLPHLGEEDANALMNEFPASEANELVTKEFLRAELGDLSNKLMAWSITTMFAGIGLAVAITRALG